MPVLVIFVFAFPMKEQESPLSCGEAVARVQKLLCGISSVVLLVNKCDALEEISGKGVEAKDGTVQRYEGIDL